MPVFDWDSAGNRWVTDTLIDCNTVPVNNDDLCNKLYVDTVVGGAALFMSQYATPQLAVAAAIASGVNAIFVDDVFTITVPVNLNSDGLAFIGLGEDTGFIVNDAAATGALTIPNANVVVKDISIAVTNCVAAADIITVAGTRCRFEGITMTFGGAVVANSGINLTAGADHMLERISVDAAGATVTYGIIYQTDRTSILNSYTSSATFNIYQTGIPTGSQILGGLNVDAADTGIYFNLTVAGTVITAIVANLDIRTPTNDGIGGNANAGTELQSIVKGVHIWDPGRHGISGIGHLIDSCTFSSYGTSAIQTNGEDLAILNCYGASAAPAGPAIKYTNSTDAVRIENNQFFSQNQPVIELNVLKRSTIANNIIFAIGAWGIRVIVEADEGVITGNDIVGGISITGGAGAINGDFTIVGNEIYTSPSHGIELLGNLAFCTITGNVIRTPTTNGIDVAAGIDHCVIANNVIRDVTDGIYLADCDYCAVNGNAIDTCGDNGIELDGNSARNKVGDNVTSTCTTDGVFLADTADFNLVTCNQVPDGITMGAGADNEHYYNKV